MKTLPPWRKPGCVSALLIFTIACEMRGLYCLPADLTDEPQAADFLVTGAAGRLGRSLAARPWAVRSVCTRPTVTGQPRHSRKGATEQWAG
jgi:hypothetical protein